jgi:hypothetical protein
MGIKTKIEEMVVHTVTYNKLWVTIASSDKLQDPIKKITSIDADNWYDAGVNHLLICQRVMIALLNRKSQADILPVLTAETEQTTQE